MSTSSPGRVFEVKGTGRAESRVGEVQFAREGEPEMRLRS